MSRKRRRDEAAEPVFEKDADFWLRDGNVVLVCELTGFCVHRSVLALHSAVFKGMLSDETLSTQQFEGRPILALLNPAEDVHRMLKALYSRHYATEQKQDFAVQASLLRMSSTYMLHSVRKEVLARLKVLLPSTLSAYQSPERHALLPADFDPALAVQLSEQCAVPAILPTALYFCAVQRDIRGAAQDPVCDDPATPPEVQMKSLRFMNCLQNLTDDIFLKIDGTAPPAWRSLANGRWLCVRHAPHNTQPPCAGFLQRAKQRIEIMYKRLVVDVFQGDLVIDTGDGVGICFDCRRELLLYQSRVRSLLWDTIVVASGSTTWSEICTSQEEEERRRES